MKSEKLAKIFSFVLQKKFILSLFIFLAVITGVKQYAKGSYNNYKIFKYTYWHSVNQRPLYELSPTEYADSNHYGPVFAMVIAPFALLPDFVGTTLWNIANVLILYFGIYSLPIKEKTKSLIALIIAHEALGAMLSYQFNVGLTGLILLSFSYSVSQKEVKSAFSIALGTLVKLYGIIGLAFFFFVKRKWMYILFGILAFVMLLILPSILSSPQYVLASYQDWFKSLTEKNSLNASLTSGQDISLMGLVRRISGDNSIPSFPFIITGIIIFLLPYFRIKQYNYLGFRLMLLASVLIFAVIFSSSSESPTYIIAFTGIAVWFVIQPEPKSKWIIALFIFAFILTTLSPSDLFPKYLREQYVWKYSLKALPSVIVWVIIIFQMLTVDFKNHQSLLVEE